MRRTLERSQRVEQRQKRWSWGGLSDSDNKNGMIAFSKWQNIRSTWYVQWLFFIKLEQPSFTDCPTVCPSVSRLINLWIIKIFWQSWLWWFIVKGEMCNLCSTRLIYDYGISQTSQKWHASPLTSHVCLYVVVCNTTGMEISCCQLRFSTSLTFLWERVFPIATCLSLPLPQDKVTVASPPPRLL